MSPILTRLLEGELPPGKLILLYGRGGADKTNIAILCAVTYAMRGFKVLYFDSEGSFSRVRLDYVKRVYPQTIEKILLMHPKTFWEQGKCIRALEQFIYPQVKLVIFESINFLYRVALDGTSQTAFSLNRELNFQLGFLKELSRKYNLPILLTSQVRVSLDGEVEPVAARILKSWCDIIVFLEPNEQAQKTVATLIKPAVKEKVEFRWLKYKLWLKRA